ncbi:histidine kinase OS=Cellulomonas persica OX=76861 GN=CPE01_02220 PE=4 SV=1 [Cellulomonas persica]
MQELDATTADVLLGQAERLSRLARDLAAVTHAEAGDITLDLEPIQPEELVDAAVHAWAERAATAGVDVRSHAERPLPAVRVDHNRMAQVLDNLLANALRHTPSGGRITLRASRRDDQVCLEVSDTGTGIAAEHLPHVFERFYRAETARDRDSGGSGIGLAISKALVEAQGGTIHVASPGEDGGATFTITLPAAAEA